MKPLPVCSDTYSWCRCSRCWFSRPARRAGSAWTRIDAKYIHETTAWPTPWQPFIPWVHKDHGEQPDADREPWARGARAGAVAERLQVPSLRQQHDRDQRAGGRPLERRTDASGLERVRAVPERAKRIEKLAGAHARRALELLWMQLG